LILDIPEWIGTWIGHDEVRTRQIDEAYFSARGAAHVGTMTRLGYLSTGAAGGFGIFVGRAAEHFIGGISIFGMLGERVRWNRYGRDGAGVAGRVGEARVPGYGALVVAARGAPLPGAARLGLDVGER